MTNTHYINLIANIQYQLNKLKEAFCKLIDCNPRETTIEIYKFSDGDYNISIFHSTKDKRYSLTFSKGDKYE